MTLSPAPFPYLTVDYRAREAWISLTIQSGDRTSFALVSALTRLLDELEPQALETLFIRNKGDDFWGQTDLSQMLRMRPAELATFLIEFEALLQRIEQFPTPIVAVIHGACLGPGFALALACHRRIASAHPRTRFGTPEVHWGLIPVGTSWRLPRLIGLQNALSILLSSRQISAREARALQLVDALVEKEKLSEQASQWMMEAPAGKPLKRKKQRSVLQWGLESTAVGRQYLYYKSQQRLQEKTRGYYATPFRVLHCVRSAQQKGPEVGAANERQALISSLKSAETQRLLRLWQNLQDRQKLSTYAPRKVRHLGVIGLSPAARELVSLGMRKGFSLVWVDPDQEGLQGAKDHLREDMHSLVQRQSGKAAEVNGLMARLETDSSTNKLAQADLIWTDVSININSPQQAFKPECIYGLDHGFLSLKAIANKHEDPGRWIGLHYGAHHLLEIGRSKQTEEEVVEACLEMGRRQGKTCIVVQDKGNGYINRLLAAYLYESLLLIQDGIAAEKIEDAICALGFAKGPVSWIADLGQRQVQTLLNGPWRRAVRARKLPPIPQISDPLSEAGLANRHHPAPIFIQHRLMLSLVSEAAHCLQQGVVASPADGDVAAVLGLGFPDFLGGPFRYLDGLGLRKAHHMLTELVNSQGPRFRPAQILRKKANRKQAFYATLVS